MTKKEKKEIAKIIVQTRLKMSAIGYASAVIFGKDAKELRNSIEKTWLGLLGNKEIAEKRIENEQLELDL